MILIKALTLLLIALPLNAGEVKLIYDDICYGQCSTEIRKNNYDFEYAGFPQININFSDGLYKFSNKNGKKIITDSLDEFYTQVSEEISNYPQAEIEKIGETIVLIGSHVDLAEKNSKQSLVQGLIRANNQKNFCENNPLFNICKKLLLEIPQRIKNLTNELNNFEARKNNCFKEHTISSIAKNVLPITNAVINSYHPGRQNLSIAGPYCNIGAGITSAVLDELGFERGKDYLFQAGMGHVYLTLPKENKLIDPTFAQFFIPNSKTQNQILEKSGFIGTPDELFSYLYDHREDLQFCRKKDSTCHVDNFSKEMQKIVEMKSEHDGKKAIIKLFSSMFYSNDWNPDERFLIETAISTSDYFGKKKEFLLNSGRPELKILENKVSNIECASSNQKSSPKCMYQPQIELPNAVEFTKTLEFIEIMSINKIEN